MVVNGLMGVNGGLMGVNGGLMDCAVCCVSDCSPYVTELLSHIEDTALRQNIASMMVPRNKLDIGEMIGKGMLSGNTVYIKCCIFADMSTNSFFCVLIRNLASLI
jgi:hypothetical protein